MKPTCAIGSVPILSGHAIAYRWRSLPRVRRHRASKSQGSSGRRLSWQVTMDPLICASLSHTDYWYEVGMLKVPAESGAGDVPEVEAGMPTRGSNVQRHHCGAARKTKSMRPGCAIGTRGGCWGDGGCQNIDELVRSGECMACLKLKAWKVSQFWKEDDVVECKPDRNRPSDLTWNRKPDRNQTTYLTRNRKPDHSKPSFSGTVHFQPR